MGLGQLIIQVFVDLLLSLNCLVVRVVRLPQGLNGLLELVNSLTILLLAITTISFCEFLALDVNFV